MQWRSRSGEKKAHKGERVPLGDDAAKSRPFAEEEGTGNGGVNSSRRKSDFGISLKK